MMASSEDTSPLAADANLPAKQQSNMAFHLLAMKKASTYTLTLRPGCQHIDLCSPSTGCAEQNYQALLGSSIQAASQRGFHSVTNGNDLGRRVPRCPSPLYTAGCYKPGHNMGKATKLPMLKDMEWLQFTNVNTKVCLAHLTARC